MQVVGTKSKDSKFYAQPESMQQKCVSQADIRLCAKCACVCVAVCIAANGIIGINLIALLNQFLVFCWRKIACKQILGAAWKYAIQKYTA